MKQAVKGRVPRYSFGTDKMARFDFSNPKHRGRRPLRKTDGTFVTGVWSMIVNEVGV
jgi:hypothetical protein